TVYADEVIPFVDEAQLDPSFRVACLTVHELRGPTGTDAGAYDLGARRWLWRQRLVGPGAHGMVTAVLGTADSCWFVLDGTRVERRGFADGVPMNGPSVSPFRLLGDMTARWSDDRSVVALVELSETTEGRYGAFIDRRDARTLLSLGRSFEPSPRPKPPERSPEVWPAPWALLSTTMVAHQDETGLFLWDHGNQQKPRRVPGAPALVRFRDEYDRMLPHELVV